MDALAITDHGVMFGVMEFYLEAKKAGIKPLLGVEAYVAPQGIQHKKGDGEKSAYHLLLLAKDKEGYRNLCHLSSIAALEGFYHKPRVDHELLRKYSGGLIATSACLGSEVCQELLKGNYDRAQYIAGMYSEIYGEGNFFIELQDHRLPEQARITPDLIRISRELKLPLVATNDAHYLCKADSVPHDVLLCIQSGANVSDEKRMRFSTPEFYLKDQAEMSELFREYPEALENTARIAEMCNVDFGKQRAPMPRPDVPEGISDINFLRELAVKGLDRTKEPEKAMERLEYELGVIEKTNFADYFLLVREFAKATRDRGIYFGVRGSAAGSLVSYCVGITDVDPVEYGLTFERFLNPERISMPDVDMDFEDARRDEIIQYVTDRFGKDHVAQIVTFGTMGAKGAIKDCGRVQGYTPQETDRLTKIIPTAPGWTLKRAHKELAEFRQLVETDPRMKSLYETALTVEGISRNAGVHAAGVVISRDPLVDFVPLTKGSDGQAVTAYEMGILEKLGMLKMDFLGLSNLTVLARCVENIHRRFPELNFDVAKIPLDDQGTYDMLARGETIGVFQLESGGMTRWVMQLKPNSVRELAAMIALFRPGPMEHIPRFIDTKFGRIKPKYIDDRMRPILEETYGVIVYQDQVMQVVQAIAGFTLGKADVLRRAMGKKDVKAMDSMKVEFMEGTAAHGISTENAESVWELLLPFAGYAFNKAHAVCYSLLAYQTAYLKANYPVEYMAALLSVYLDKEDRVTVSIEECRRQKIPVLPPNVNSSGKDFTIQSVAGGKKQESVQAIRFGLLAIKGVGEGIVDGIIHERNTKGLFKHLFEFAERTKSTGMGRTALEALIRAGALDSIDENRHRLLKHVDAALQFADTQNRSRLAGQNSLFLGDGGEGGQSSSYPPLPPVDPPTRGEILAMEKEVMGIYVSDHPLRGLERVIQQNSTHTCAAALEGDDGTPVKLAGVIAKMKSIVTKSEGKRMATLVLEDFSGQIGAIAFNKTYERYLDILVKDATVQLSGAVMHREMRGEKSIEIRIEEIRPLDTALDLGYTGGSGTEGTVTIRIWRATETQLAQLRRIIDEHPGDYECVVQIMRDGGCTPIYLTQNVKPTDTFCRAIEKSLARAEVEVQHNER